jgi:hypothetical protein
MHSPSILIKLLLVSRFALSSPFPNYYCTDQVASEHLDDCVAAFEAAKENISFSGVVNGAIGACTVAIIHPIDLTVDITLAQSAFDELFRNCPYGRYNLGDGTTLHIDSVTSEVTHLAKVKHGLSKRVPRSWKHIVTFASAVGPAVFWDLYSAGCRPQLRRSQWTDAEAEIVQTGMIGALMNAANNPGTATIGHAVMITVQGVNWIVRMNMNIEQLGVTWKDVLKELSFMTNDGTPVVQDFAFQSLTNFLTERVISDATYSLTDRLEKTVVTFGIGMFHNV